MKDDDLDALHRRARRTAELLVLAFSAAVLAAFVLAAVASSCL